MLFVRLYIIAKTYLLLVNNKIVDFKKNFLKKHTTLRSLNISNEVLVKQRMLCLTTSNLLRDCSIRGKY